MQCLIDGDVIQYEIGFASETAWRHKNVDKPREWFIDNPPPWELVREQLDARIAHIEMACEATEPSQFFFTGSTNFRHQIARRVPYKERNNMKPFHYKNIKESIKGRYDWHQQDGLEADDLMGCYQHARRESKSTIICTRDKDLRQVAGWHYGWELAKQPSFGPFFVEGYGHIELNDKRKLKGWGNKFFLAQCIMGDGVDTVEGLKKGVGDVYAFEVVNPTTTYAEGREAVYEAYKAVYGEAAKEEMLEQAQLLWMLREPHQMWTFNYEE